MRARRRPSPRPLRNRRPSDGFRSSSPVARGCHASRAPGTSRHQRDRAGTERDGSIDDDRHGRDRHADGLHAVSGTMRDVAMAETLDLGPNKRDRSEHATGQHQPCGCCEGGRTVTGDDDRCRCRRDACCAAQLGHEAAAPTPHVIPELDGDQRGRERNRYKPHGARGDDCYDAEHGQECQLDDGDPCCPAISLEPSTSTMVDGDQLHRGTRERRASPQPRSSTQARRRRRAVRASPARR